MTKSLVELNLPGLNQVMKSPGVVSLLEQRARAIAEAAGDGFEVQVDNTHPWVARAWVQAATSEARRAEATDRALTRAVGSTP